MADNEREELETTAWQRIGEIPVDSGQVVLVDPRCGEDVAGYVMDALTFEPVANELGIPLAVVVSTGLGDGFYPVEARFSEAGGAVRVAEVRIRFLPHPLLGYELPR
jgi:hypothetical protein